MTPDGCFILALQAAPKNKENKEKHKKEELKSCMETYRR